MKLATRCLVYGALPYLNTDSTERMMFKLFEKTPFLPMLPEVSAQDNLKEFLLTNVPGVSVTQDGIFLNPESSMYEYELAKLNTAFNKPDLANLDSYALNPAYLEKYLQFIAKYKPTEAIFSFWGPFTLSQLVKHSDEENFQFLEDEDFRDLFVKSVAVKVLWFAEKIKEVSANTTPIVIVDEPLLGMLGDIKRGNEKVTAEAITEMFASLINKLKEAGIVVGIQCMAKCDWSIPINAGADIISYDAYNNPNNLCIIPGLVRKFIAGGGLINWCIVPVMTESVIKSASIESVTERLRVTMQGLVEAGISESLIQNSALVSLQGNVNGLPLIFAEKALILATQLGKKIPFKL